MINLHIPNYSFLVYFLRYIFCYENSHTGIENRISPRFDFAPGFGLYDIEGERITGSRNISCEGWSDSERVSQLKAFGVDTLICGGLSGVPTAHFDQQRNEGDSLDSWKCKRCLIPFSPGAAQFGDGHLSRKREKTTLQERDESHYVIGISVKIPLTEIDLLKSQAEVLKQQLKGIESRIKGLEREKERTMKICISSTKNDLEASVNPRFGRCQYFLFVDTETMHFEAVRESRFYRRRGAGIQAAQAVVNKGANVVLTGDVGPNAFQALQAGGIKIVTGAQGLVKDVIERFNKGELGYAGAPSVESHAGMRR